LLDALDHGFCSVEADIHLVDGELLVAHDLHQTRPGITLKSLYLQPLRERVQLSNGRVYPHGPDFILLIDIKSDADATYPVLRDQLRDYADILTRFEPGRITTNAVTAILSGNRPDRLLRAEAVRYAAYDGRIHDLDANPPLDFMPLVSDNWRSVFQWRGQGPLPEADQKRLQHLVARAHEQQRRIRFWAVPDQPAAWQILHDAGVDLINTDNLSGLREFLLSLDPR
jgi:glycerophosphoryl diester phosphodiesterase